MINLTFKKTTSNKQIKQTNHKQTIIHFPIKQFKLTKVLLVEVPAVVASARRALIFQTILTMHVIFLPQILILQHFICSVDLQKLFMGFRIILLYL